ncbi:MFS transporter [Acrocarpospora corrugata]|nr:MFS transporter [Acrocarpospora corrugata]
MRAYIPLRVVRSAAFTAVCVALAALGHWFAGGLSPGAGTALLGAGGVLGVTILAAGRERSPAVITGLLGAGQLFLHELFTLTSQPAHPLHGHDLSVDVGMLLCHLVAALIAGWWVARGEAALWSVLCRLVGDISRLLPVLLSGPAQIDVVARFKVADVSGFALLERVLRYAVLRRGPPLPAGC